MSKPSDFQLPDFNRVLRDTPLLPEPIDMSEMMQGVHEANAERSESHRATKELAKIANASLASEFKKRLEQYIVQFDKALDQDHEVGLRLVTFGQAVSFHVESVGYFNPHLITFFGFNENNQRVQLVQHVSQLSFLLIALPKADPSKPKRPYGFASFVAPKVE